MSLSRSRVPETSTPIAFSFLISHGRCRLVSRNRNAYKRFEPLAQAISQELSGRSAILDGEIVRPGPDGRPMFSS